MERGNPHNDVFISYSKRDKSIAEAIVTNLEDKGICCWFAPRDIEEGEDWPTAISAAIRATRAFVLVYTDHSNSSLHVARELRMAASKEKLIIPFRLTKHDLSEQIEYYLAGVMWFDALTPPLEKRVTALCSTIKAILSKSSDWQTPEALSDMAVPSREESDVDDTAEWYAAPLPRRRSRRGSDRGARLSIGSLAVIAALVLAIAGAYFALVRMNVLPPSVSNDRVTPGQSSPTEPLPSQSFPSNWVGSFGGSSKSGSTVDKHIWMSFDRIEGDGTLTGTCTVGPDAADSAEASGSYALKGIIDWETNKIRLYGTSWIDRGGLAFMRNFEGTYSPENGTIVGTCETTSGSRGSLWSMTAA